MSLGAEQEEVVPQQKLQVLLQQYRECSAHHVCMYQLMWQVPAVTVTASGLLVAAAFGYNVPSAARLVVSLMGMVFVFMMAVAIERNRMFQLRRRKDMLAIEQEFALIGAAELVDVLGVPDPELCRGPISCVGLRVAARPAPGGPPLSSAICEIRG